MLISYQAAANSHSEFAELADFFRLLEAGAPVDLFFYYQGKEVSRSEGVVEGYAERFGEPFDRFVIESPTQQSIQFVARLGNVVQYDKAPQGDTLLVNDSAFTQSTVNVGVASTSIAAANPQRRYLMLQNSDPVNAIRVKFGSAPTLASGLLIAAGGMLEFVGPYVPIGELFGICAAANPNIEVLEG